MIYAVISGEDRDLTSGSLLFRIPGAGRGPSRAPVILELTVQSCVAIAPEKQPLSFFSKPSRAGPRPAPGRRHSFYKLPMIHAVISGAALGLTSGSLLFRIPGAGRGPSRAPVILELTVQSCVVIAPEKQPLSFFSKPSRAGPRPAPGRRHSFYKLPMIHAVISGEDRDDGGWFLRFHTPLTLIARPLTQILRKICASPKGEAKDGACINCLSFGRGQRVLASG